MSNVFFDFCATSIKDRIRIKPICDYENRYVLSSGTILENNNLFTVDEESKWHDIIRFQDVSNFAISKKVKTILELNNISGWSCFLIQIKSYENKEFYAFQILSKAGKILNLEALNNYIEDSIRFDESSWNGTDFFTLENTGLTICNSKVVDLFAKNKINNVKFNFL